MPWRPRGALRDLKRELPKGRTSTPRRNPGAQGMTPRCPQLAAGEGSGKAAVAMAQSITVSSRKILFHLLMCPFEGRKSNP